MLNYSDVFFGFHFNEMETCVHMAKDHMLVYVYSGELLLEEGKNSDTVRLGECMFLREYYRKMDKSKLSTDFKDCDASVIQVPPTPDITSLFSSMILYFDSSIKLTS